MDDYHFDPNEAEFKEDEKEEKIELPHTVTLEAPLKVGNLEPVGELVFSEALDLGMIEHLPVGGGWKYGHFTPVIARMTKTDPALIKKLQRDDLMACVKVVNYFF